MELYRDEKIMMLDDEKLTEVYLNIKNKVDELAQIITENASQFEEAELKEKLKEFNAAVYNFRKCAVEFENRRRTQEFAKTSR